MSKIEVDKVDPQSGTALEIGTSGDTVTVPSGVGLTLTDSTLLLPTTINTDKIDPKSGTALEIGTSGDTITVPTGAGLTVTDEVKTNKISPATGVAFALGDSGDTFTVPAGATIVNSGTATGFGGGKVLQVVQTVKTDTTSTTSSSFEDMTGMSLAITPTAASSKILIMGVYCFNISGEVVIRFQFDVDGGGYNTIDGYTGDADSTSPRSSCGANHDQSMPFSPMFLHSPSYTLTDVLTYKAQWGTINHGNTAYLNRQYANTGTADYPVMASTMVLMEIGA